MALFNDSHTGHSTWHSTGTLHLLHLRLHLHHVASHSFLHIWVLLANVVHYCLLEIVVVDTFLDKERVFNLGLVNKHIDHHFHLVTSLSGLALDNLLLHGIHGELLASLESSKGLLLLELGALFGLGEGVVRGEFTLLSGHDHLGVLGVLGHLSHGNLELLLIGLREEFEDLAHDDLTHLVFLLELVADDVTVLLPVILLEGFAARVQSLLALSLSSLTARARDEIEKLAHILRLKHCSVGSLFDNMEVLSFKVGKEVATSSFIIFILVTKNEMVEQGGTNESGGSGDSEEETLVFVVVRHFDVFIFYLL